MIHLMSNAQYIWSSVFLPAYTLKILELCVVVLLSMTIFKGWYFKTSIHHTRSTRLREIAEADILNKSNAFLDSEHSAAPDIKHTNGILHCESGLKMLALLKSGPFKQALRK